MHDARNHEAARNPGQGCESRRAEQFPPLHRQVSLAMEGMTRSTTEKALALREVS